MNRIQIDALTVNDFRLGIVIEFMMKNQFPIMITILYHFYSKSLASKWVSNKVIHVRPICMTMFKKFFQNTSFHGFHFLVRRDVHWTERCCGIVKKMCGRIIVHYFSRVFWLSSCILSWYSSSLLIQARWENFRHSAVSFVAETTYLDWNTTFPSVVVCESDNEEKIAEVTDR